MNFKKDKIQSVLCSIMDFCEKHIDLSKLTLFHNIFTLHGLAILFARELFSFICWLITRWEVCTSNLKISSCDNTGNK